MMIFKLLLVNVVLIVTLLPYLCNGTAQEMSKSEKSSDGCNAENCRLPLCKCSKTNGPSAIQFDDTPMMIGLSFNGIVTTEHSKYLNKILNPIFKNPNACPIQATFFTSDTSNVTTDYCLLQTYFNNNNEIAVSGTKYGCPYTDCESLGRHFMRWKEDSADADIYEQKRNIANKAKINRSFLRGFRLPLLDQRGNYHFKALKKYAFNYESSAIIRPDDIKRNGGFRIWPHTLDFPPHYSCPTCPTKKSLCKGNENCSLSSVWVVPLHYLDAEGQHPCPTLIKDEVAENRMDTNACVTLNRLTQQVLENQLLEDFNRHYKTNKAPFIINIETSWFQKYPDILTNALVNFVNELTKPNTNITERKDIYFVTISQIIEWIQYPTPLNVIANKWLWNCDGTNYDYDDECDSIKKLRLNSEELEESRKRNKTQSMDLQAEDLFRNGIFSGVIIIFILSILFTVFYDKYH